MTDLKRIPVLKPKLPETSKLVPYLTRIDHSRWYTNHGPLTKELEAKLSSHFGGGSPEEAVLVSNGTEALTISLLSFDRPQRTHCIVPSWTFAATPLAAIHAGLTPVFADIDPKSWAITPHTVRAAIQELGLETSNIHSVVPVSPFGAPISILEWQRFQDETGIQILIDAAASFDSVAQSKDLRSCTIPIMISLHATKVFGVGEGALVLCQNPELINSIRKCINFGFWGTRETQLLGKNAKLSEYSSAVGLAEYDGWKIKRDAWASCTKSYLEHANRLRELGVSFLPGYGENWISSYCNVTFPTADDQIRVARRLAEMAIETRSWWGNGAHGQRVFASYPRGSMSATEALSTRTLGLPFFTDLEAGDIDRVVTSITEILKE